MPWTGAEGPGPEITHFRTHRQVTLSVGAPREKEDPRISEIPSISKVIWNAEAVADLMVQGFQGGQRMDKRRKEAQQKGFQKRADPEQDVTSEWRHV